MLAVSMTCWSTVADVVLGTKVKDAGAVAPMGLAWTSREMSLPSKVEVPVAAVVARLETALLTLLTAALTVTEELATLGGALLEPLAVTRLAPVLFVLVLALTTAMDSGPVPTG
jgi:hypothetical protein